MTNYAYGVKRIIDKKILRTILGPIEIEEEIVEKYIIKNIKPKGEMAGPSLNNKD